MQVIFSWRGVSRNRCLKRRIQGRRFLFQTPVLYQNEAYLLICRKIFKLGRGKVWEGAGATVPWPLSQKLFSPPAKSGWEKGFPHPRKLAEKRMRDSIHLPICDSGVWLGGLAGGLAGV
jgi:hypothetical protein